jgi:hypothetical protein
VVERRRLDHAGRFRDLGRDRRAGCPGEPLAEDGDAVEADTISLIAFEGGCSAPM